MFKDRDNINHRNEKEYGGNIRLLADAIRENDKSPGALRAFLLKGGEKLGGTHSPSHEACDYKSSDNRRVTEKRLCRCMYYYNLTPRQSSCESCDFPCKRKNVGSFEKCDHETPLPEAWKEAGGIDLLLREASRPDIFYGVEVKPPSSRETLVRMAAEILTYAQIGGQAVISLEQVVRFLPGICFFEGSAQAEDYEKYRNDLDFQSIMTRVSVFVICYTTDKFRIEKLWQPPAAP